MAPMWMVFLVFVATNFVADACNRPTVNMVPHQTYHFASPNYPSPYPHSRFSCYYSYVAPVNHKIRLSCTYIDILNSNNCQNSAFLVWKNGDVSTNDYYYYCSFFRNGITLDSYDRFLTAQFVNSAPNYYNQYGFSCSVEAYYFEDPSTCECGLENKQRIVGGAETEENAYPWITAITRKDGRIFCGGVLINDQWVLTAAHCFESFTADTISLMLGAHDVLNPKSSVMIVDAAQVIVHEGYNITTTDNDIALVQLATRVLKPYPTNISPICLPFGLTSDDYKHRIATVIGWGVEDFSSDTASDVLQEVDVDVYTSEQCNSHFSNVTGRITSNMFCGYREGKDACRGDSGGPFVLNKDGLNYEIGIVSWGIDCAKPGNPGVYTKLINYLSWIEQKTRETFCKPLLRES